MALRKEYDYLVPPELAATASVGTRVKVPFGHRQVVGCITGLADQSTQTALKSILKIVGTPKLVTAKVLALSRWLGEYYCCAPELALKSVLPQSVRREQDGWRERLYVMVLPAHESPPKLTARQQEVLLAVQAHPPQVAMQELLRLTGATASVVRRLKELGLVEIAAKKDERDPYARETILPSHPLPLHGAQEQALAAVRGAMDAGGGGVFLLHGVTGSGKTEVYLQAIAHALSRGQGAIVLVPEISLTPQTVERFKSRFGHGPQQTLVAVLHSHLSEGERHDEWHKIREGRARIVIGARSAIFAPVEPLGLVVVDEEHETSYKQEESPRYHARDVAVMRGRLEGAVVVLGSATPSLESYHNAQRGKYTLLELPVRADDKKLPVVRVVDMRPENYKDKGPPIFSQRLKEGILQRLDRREQVIIFLNRRGYATSLQCPKCGHVCGCPNCSLSLTYHRHEGRLRCHLCGHAEPAPRVCPNQACASPAIRFAGVGTERVEETLRQLFPRATVSRMDSDTLRRKEDYRRILGDFRTGKIDILLGTQMIAKGLHFPNVTLVGIVHADMALHLPDFRAGERTFQLLTQVAGRAGRGDVEGEVVVQSFTPHHPAIQFARRHDYEGFYEAELEFRSQLRYPPAARVALITFKGRNEDAVAFAAQHVKRELETALSTIGDLILAGPAPAPLPRAESLYRYQIMLRTAAMARLSTRLAAVVAGWKLPEGVAWAVDIDPVNLM